MRPLFSFLTTLAAFTIGTTASDASVFTFGSNLEKQDWGSSLGTSATLQQLLELRMRGSTTSTLETSDSNIELLSRLAGPPSPLFREPVESENLNAVLVILEGLEGDIDSSIRNEYKRDLVTAAFPTMSAINAFFEALLESGPERIVGPESKRCSSYSHDYDARLCLPTSRFSRNLQNELVNQITATESWVDEQKGTEVVRIAFEPSATYINCIKNLFSELQTLSSNGISTTVVVLPISSATERSFYTRRASKAMNVHSARNSQPMTFEQRTNVPLALAPVCYSSNSSCNEGTNSCSDHGLCYKKSGSESEEGSGDCYACSCHETYVKNGDGTERKVRWGGSACQKKDVSSPFFLISGVTIAVMVAVSAAIGLTYSVGNTELPGVISAGVGAVRAQK
ncbi:hypothetical protein BJX99DRAFT_251203 [Aspergillus californicus]